MFKSKFAILLYFALGASAVHAQAFNNLTIGELLAIDEARALENEREQAEKMGLIVPGYSSVSSEVASIDVAPIEEDLTDQEEIVISPPQLKSIYGVGRQLQAEVIYKDHLYLFTKGSKTNQAGNGLTDLSLTSFSGKCLELLESSENKLHKVCMEGNV